MSEIATTQRGLPRVDPRTSGGPLHRAWVSLLGTRPAAWLFCTPLSGWLSRRVLWNVDPVLMRLSGGRIGSRLVLPTALLETRGARTGRTRRNAVIYFHDGDRVTVIASKLGAPAHPSWYYNARANPDVVFGGQRFRALVIEDEAERSRLWDLADRVFPIYAAYRRKAAQTGRTIPVLQLKAEPSAVDR